MYVVGTPAAFGVNPRVTVTAHAAELVGLAVTEAPETDVPGVVEVGTPLKPNVGTTGATKAFTVKVNPWLVVCAGFPLSVTPMIKEYWLPGVVGVPLITPAELKLRPEGNAPGAVVQVYGGFPLAAVKVAE